MNTHHRKTIRPALHNRVLLGATFAQAAFSYWLTVFPRVWLHIARWERLARRIPNPVLRDLAIAALVDKRGNIEGAAAFAAFAPRRRRGRVTLALSAFQSAYNLLDMLGEQPSADPVSDGRRLHEALLYALTPPGESGPGDKSQPGGKSQPGSESQPGGESGQDGESGREGGDGRAVDSDSPSDSTWAAEGTGLYRGEPSDWYEHHPHRNDGGYLDKLLEQCRTALADLPSYGLAAGPARAAAARIVAFQSLNLSESQGDHMALEQWALQATPPGCDLRWWEVAAAAGSSLGVHVLIAAGAEPRLDKREVTLLERAYFPWIGGLHSLLDNLIDKHEDEAAGHRSLVEYYGPRRAAQRMRWLAEEAGRLARELPHSHRHTVILAAMIGNYLSTPEAHSSELEPVTRAVLATTGPLAKPTMLVFKLRRLGHFRPWPRKRT